MLLAWKLVYNLICNDLIAALLRLRPDPCLTTGSTAVGGFIAIVKNA